MLLPIAAFASSVGACSLAADFGELSGGDEVPDSAAALPADASADGEGEADTGLAADGSSGGAPDVGTDGGRTVFLD